MVPMMACNILLYTYQEEEDWPESFVKVYVEDALGDRVWVDNEHCRSFVENIWTAFGTKTVPRSLARQHSDPLGKQGQLEQTAAGASQGAGLFTLLLTFCIAGIGPVISLLYIYIYMCYGLDINDKYLST